MTFSLRTLTLLLFVPLLLAGGQAPAAAKAAPKELTFQSTYTDNHILSRDFYKPACEAVTEKSGGTLVLRYTGIDTVVNSDATVDALTQGLLDMGGIGPQYRPHLFPRTLPFQAPFIVENSIQGSALYWHAYMNYAPLKAEWDKICKVLTVWGSDRSGIFSVRTPILSPADMQGKNVLIWDSTQVALVQAWGGVPVRTLPTDTFHALENGLADIFFGPLPVGVAYDVMQIAKQVTILPATSLFLVNGVNWDVWNSLTPEQQALIEAELGGEAASIKSGQLLVERTNRDLETMKAAGCTIHQLDTAQLATWKTITNNASRAMQRDLARYGVQEPETALKQAYDMAAQVGGTQP